MVRDNFQTWEKATKKAPTMKRWTPKKKFLVSGMNIIDPTRYNTDPVTLMKKFIT